ncbi:5-formyltetrahydrofolate cyclo-ligase [Pontixanthobacter gangjinensis]|uniref:5-formyltetrahydrofolate cyclo-ligase n=1 Tax=Pontixanthobacter gangjinensis TaxID=1028742 RepID=A0A6I4SN29_9SPHN|nr:5-formyltetrahydrofolate cyclo-ligase [Pontixanthobacter gangjinensis]MXO57153.1 5-formyltetrahydrofolate cyclo-ligase [Pontixanthobacter gangjinensis]
MSDKASLRKDLRAARAAHVKAIPANVRALLFRQPPAPLLALIPTSAIIGLYHAGRDEAPAAAYARFFSESGHTIALPRFDGDDEAMQFAEYDDPFGESGLEKGISDIMQPTGDSRALTPDVLFMPVIGFTASGERLGQGGGHYDRWLAANPETITIGMGWDSQLMDELPIEPHDQNLTAVVTPTRLYGPF